MPCIGLKKTEILFQKTEILFGSTGGIKVKYRVCRYKKGEG